MSTNATMLRKTATRSVLIFLFIAICFVFPGVQAVTIASEESVEGIKLLDVSVGETEDDSACIFEINGKTVVINRRDKETYDGVTIWVKEVYAVNSKDKASDKCEFIYSLTEEYEDPVKSETIGSEIVHFLLGARTEITNTEEIEQEKEPPEETRVLVNGYDVTEKEDITADAVQAEKAEEKGIISSFFGWLFG